MNRPERNKYVPAIFLFGGCLFIVMTRGDADMWKFEPPPGAVTNAYLGVEEPEPTTAPVTPAAAQPENKPPANINEIWPVANDHERKVRDHYFATGGKLEDIWKFHKFNKVYPKRPKKDIQEIIEVLREDLDRSMDMEEVASFFPDRKFCEADIYKVSTAMTRVNEEKYALAARRGTAEWKTKEETGLIEYSSRLRCAQSQIIERMPLED